MTPVAAPLLRPPSARPSIVLSCLLALVCAAGARAQAAQPAGATAAVAIELQVDARDVDHRLFRVRERITVPPGSLTLQYPRWIPGTHRPIGNVARLAGLHIRAGGQELPWERDPADVESFRVNVPAGTGPIELRFEHLSSTVDGEDDEIIHDLLAVNWRGLLLYPAGLPAASLRVTPSVILPAGWDAAGALRAPMPGCGTGASPRASVNRLDFAPLTLERLIDSPLYSAPRMRHLVLDDDKEHPVCLHVLANEAAQLEVSAEQLAAHARLVRQARALFGARHYDHYDFILVIDNLFGFHGGLEHHQSSENGVKRGYFADAEKSVAQRALLPHEFTHSWNGKFRRPRDLWTPTYNDTPMQGSLLWVYEGLTNYWGQVLAARSGLVSEAVARNNFAEIAARALQRAGRSWRNLQDTTDEPVIARTYRHKDWVDWQRTVDYYAEGSLLWLAVDVKLRELTRDRRSLDDFARSFFGVDDGRIDPELYGFDDVVQALDAIAHYDWAGYLRHRLDTHDDAGLLDGLEHAGWRLAYGDTPGAFTRSLDEMSDTTSLLDSLGLAVDKDNVLTHVVWGGPAFAAGLATGNTLVAVDGRSYRPDLLKDAVKRTGADPAPVVLLMRDADMYRNVAIDYHGGLRYPTLERITADEDRLARILAPR